MSMLIFAAAVLLIKPAINVMAEVLATAIAAYYIWRSNRIRHRLIAIGHDIAGQGRNANERVDRAHRRLLAQGLTNSVRMTAHFSLFPTPTLRAIAIVRWLRPHG